jgi:predicted transcriptional regulator of viral defense system
MRKPPTGSKDSLTTEDMFEILKTKVTWTNNEIFTILVPKYLAYDKAGLKHKIRHILDYLAKQGKVVRIDKGTYLIKI